MSFVGPSWAASMVLKSSAVVPLKVMPSVTLLVSWSAIMFGFSQDVLLVEMLDCQMASQWMVRFALRAVL